MEKREKNEPRKAETSIRCAKAALLLSTLNSTQLRNLKSSEHHLNQEFDAITRELRELKFELARERAKSGIITVSDFVEFSVKVVVVMFVLLINWIILFEYF